MNDDEQATVYRCGVPNKTGGHCLTRVHEPDARCGWHNGKARYGDTGGLSAQRRVIELRQRLRDERANLPHNV